MFPLAIVGSYSSLKTIPIMFFVYDHQAIDILKQTVDLIIFRREVSRMQAYCVKCRAKKEMKDPKAITMKNKKPATQGTCPTCGTKMFRIGTHSVS
jgi:hypothetical protein